MNNRQNLKAYLDGELNASDAAQLESALKQDPLLQAELDQLRAISSVLVHSTPTVPPVGLPETLERLRQAPPKTSPWLVPAGLGLAGVAIVAAIAFTMNSDVRPPFFEDSPMPTPKHKAPFARATGFKVAADARILLEVANLDESVGKAEAIVKTLEGSVESNRVTGNGTPLQHTMLIHVPTAKLEDAVTQLKALGVPDNTEVPKSEVQRPKSETEQEPSAQKVISLILRLKNRM